MIFGIGWAVWLAWLLAAFFVGNGVVNWIGPKSMRDGFAHWGYPAWFHRFNGALQAATGLLLAFPQTRMLGIALGIAVCLGVFATLVRHREYAHLKPGLVLFALLCLCAWGIAG